MEIQIAQDRSFAKRNSPFFVKDILGLSDESETESSDEMNRESGNEEMNEYGKDNSFLFHSCFSLLQQKWKINKILYLQLCNVIPDNSFWQKM